LFKRTVGQHMGSTGNTIKLHRLSHVVAVLKRFGCLFAISAQAYEHSHGPTKQLYKRTSRRSTNGDGLKELAQRTIAYQIADSIQTSLDRERHAAAAGGALSLQTAHGRLLGGAAAALVKDGFFLEDCRVLEDAEYISSLPKDNLCSRMVAACPFVRQLPRALQTFAHPYLHAQQPGMQPETCMSIRLVKSALVAAPVSVLCLHSHALALFQVGVACRDMSYSLRCH
jgi:hypothetical protein